MEGYLRANNIFCIHVIVLNVKKHGIEPTVYRSIYVFHLQALCINSLSWSSIYFYKKFWKIELLGDPEMHLKL